MENFIDLAEHFDNCGDYELSDKLFKIAQLSTVLRNPNLNLPKSSPIDMLKKTNPLMGYALSKTGVGQEKKVLDNIAANPVVQTLGTVQEKADQVKEPISAPKKILAIANLTGWFAKSIPTMLKHLDAIEEKLDAFNKFPAVNRIFQALDIFNTLQESVTFLNDVYERGFDDLYKSDPARVIKYIAKMVQTFTNPQLTILFPPVLPLQPQLNALNTMSAGMGLMVDLATGLGNFVGKMENPGSNRIEQIPQAQAYTSQGMKAKGATMPLDQLALKYGEVYNVLLDYVNKKGTIPQLISKLGNDPGRTALMSAHIAQGILPPANGQYQISSYKRERDQAQKQNQQNYVYSPGSGGMGYVIR